jgi:hypothetical protein
LPYVKLGGIIMRITKSLLSLPVLLFGVLPAYAQEVTPREAWSSFTAAERYILGSPTMASSYGGVSAASQILAGRQAAMQAERDVLPYPAFLSIITAANAAEAFASTQDAGEFWQRYNFVTRGWIPLP